ncbi:MAG TPA: hypothetical protein VGA78_11925 [Gemmatimonadales bacterium]
MLLDALMLGALPAIAPPVAYRYMNPRYQSRWTEQVLKQVHPGDTLLVIERQLPGLLSPAALQGASGAISGSWGDVEYSMEYRAGTVHSNQLGSRSPLDGHLEAFEVPTITKLGGCGESVSRDRVSNTKCWRGRSAPSAGAVIHAPAQCSACNSSIP